MVDTSLSTSVSPYREGDYEAILSAVTETQRGRWFLAEHERRHHGAETDKILSELARLEAILHRERRPDVDRIKLDIGEMKNAIELTKLEIANIKIDKRIGSRFIHASNELDAIISQTEAATSEILESTEKIQELCYTGREDGVSPDLWDKLDELTTAVYLGCSFQDLTGQRTQKVVHALRFLEARIDSMMKIWGMDEDEIKERAVETNANPFDERPDAHLLNGPQFAGAGTAQSAIDQMMAAETETSADIDFDSIDVSGDDGAETGSSPAALDAGDAPQASSTASHQTSHQAGQPETQEEIDELFADARFTDEEQLADTAAHVDEPQPDMIAAMSARQRRAMFS